jgi:outer membrane protein assembly factor BamE (lipoprotein component of BamABCDE complex)
MISYMNKILLPIFLAIFSVCLSSCANNVTQGHLKEDASLSEIKIGTTTSTEVAKMLGSPSSASSFGKKTWYYISAIKETRSILPSKIIDQRTIEITFDDNDAVSLIKEYGLKDGKNVEIVGRYTPTEGESLGFLEQLLGNLGRFNKDAKKGLGNRAGGPNPTR